MNKWDLNDEEVMTSTDRVIDLFNTKICQVNGLVLSQEKEQANSTPATSSW